MACTVEHCFFTTSIFLGFPLGLSIATAFRYRELSVILITMLRRTRGWPHRSKVIGTTWSLTEDDHRPCLTVWRNSTQARTLCSQEPSNINKVLMHLAMEPAMNIVRRDLRTTTRHTQVITCEPQSTRAQARDFL